MLHCFRYADWYFHRSNGQILNHSKTSDNNAMKRNLGSGDFWHLVSWPRLGDRGCSASMPKIAFACVLATLAAACDLRTPSTMATAVSNTVKSDHNVISFERLYPGSEHFISYYTGTYGQSRWNSKTLIHGRYELTMQFDIDIDRAGTTLTSIEPPQFWLNKRHHVQRLPDGRLSISYAPDEGANFGATEWQKLVAANGDLSVLGIAEVDSTPVVETPDPAPPTPYPAKSVD